MAMFRRETTAARPGDVRKPRSATMSDQRVGLASVPAFSDDWMQRAYYQNVYAYACVRAVAVDLAARRFRVGADPSKPEDFDPKNKLAALLGPPPGGPNRWTSPRRIWSWSVSQFMLSGRFVWEKEYAPGSKTPVGLWPVPSKHVQAVASDGGGRWFDGFVVGSGDNARKFTAEELVYEWRPSIDDFRLPESVFAAARLDTEVMILSDRYDAAFLRNDARPAAVVVHEQFATAADKTAFQEQFNGRHRGPDNAGNVMFAEADPSGAPVDAAISVHTLGLSQRDMQMMERYETKVRSICVAAGVPMTRLMDASKRTFSNGGQESLGYWASTVWTIAQELADAVNLQLAPDFGDNVGWFDFSDVPELGPAALKAAELPALLAAQIITRNEARATPSIGLPALPDEPAPPPTPAAAPPEASQDDTGADAAATAPVTPTPVEGRSAHLDEAARELRRATVWAATDATVTSLEGEFEARMQRLLNRQKKAVVDRVVGKRGRQALAAETRSLSDAAFDPEFWTAETVDEFTVLFRTVTSMAASQQAAMLGVSFDVQAPWVGDFVRARANQLAGHVTETTYQGIKATLAEGVQAGLSIPRLAQSIETLFDQTYANRSTVVARTEVISAFNGAGLANALDLGRDIVVGSEWVSTPDGRTRPDHREVAGQVRSVGVPFDVGGEQLAYPGDPNGSAANVIQCRCTVAYVTPAEAAAFGIQGRSAEPDAVDELLHQMEARGLL